MHMAIASGRNHAKRKVRKPSFQMISAETPQFAASDKPHSQCFFGWRENGETAMPSMNTVKYAIRIVIGWRISLYIRRSFGVIFAHMPVVTVRYEPTCE